MFTSFLPRRLHSLPRPPLIALGVALVILGALGLMSYHSIERQAQAADWVSHTYLAASSLQKIFSHVQDVESAQRAFSMTGDEKYLPTYQGAVDALPGELDRLGVIISDNPVQVNQLKRLRVMVENRLRIAATRLQQRREMGAAATTPNLMNGVGMKAMEDVRAVVNEMTRTENSLLESRQHDAERARARSRLALVLGATASVVLLVGVFARLLTQMLRTAHAEREAQKSNAQLKVANNELRSFSYSVAHDLRAPLRAISGFAQVVLEDGGPQLDAENRAHLERIVHNVGTMAQLIEDLLALSKIGFQPLRSTRIEMTVLARGVYDELREAQPGRDIELTMGELPPAMGDPSLVRQVWVNLIANALKFTRRSEKARIEIGGTAAGPDFVTYYVRDNGAGFDMQYANKLFGAFQRLHRPADFEGTGIGLALVQRIVQRHGGTVWAEGQENVGARFAFTMPDWHGG